MAIYPFALEQGISIETFWESSVLDLQDLMAAKERADHEEMKKEIIIGFGTADAIATRVAYFFSDPKTRKESDIVQPWDRFPSLFAGQKEQAEKARTKAETEQYKAQFTAFADRWNRRNKDAEDSI